MPDRLVWLFVFYWIIFTILGGVMGAMMHKNKKLMVFI
ncbi:putative membrane protein [Desulfosporosinus sp. OT]|nr:putative membrane protein [Desulfosporosinus sp. OT]